MHCFNAPAARECPNCVRPACVACVAAGCRLEPRDWLGVCPTCREAFDSGARRRILADAGGSIACARCGSSRALCVLADLDDTAAIAALTSQPAHCEDCGRSFSTSALATLFTTIDRWDARAHSQRLHYLLCRCGSVIASAGGRVDVETGGDDTDARATDAASSSSQASSLHGVRRGLMARLGAWLRR